MEDLLKGAIETIGGGGIAAIATTAIGLFGWTFYKTLLNIFISPKNIDLIGDKIKEYVYKIPDPKAKGLTRIKLVYICIDIIKDLGYSQVIHPGAANILINEKNRLNN